LTIPAGQTTSEAIRIQTWEEQVSMGGRKAIDSSTALGEGNEGFAIRIVDNCGCQVVSSSMHVTIVDEAPYKWHSPIAIDLNNDGLKSVSIDKGVTFDILGNGAAVNVGWLSKQDGWLAVDSSGNGKIDSKHELFGGEIGEGFAKLSQYDSNGDNIVDAQDVNFSDLKIWRDSNTNGVTDSGELQALSVFGIESLNVEHTAYQDAAEFDKHGNILGERGLANTFSGNTLSMVDLYVQVADAAI
jgi:serine-aspartate repeat-containing protein C/D/E